MWEVSRSCPKSNVKERYKSKNLEIIFFYSTSQAENQGQYIVKNAIKNNALSGCKMSITFVNLQIKKNKVFSISLVKGIGMLI